MAYETYETKRLPKGHSVRVEHNDQGEVIVEFRRKVQKPVERKRSSGHNSRVK